MGYKRQNFSKGQTLTAEQMNNIDTGLYEACTDIETMQGKLEDLEGGTVDTSNLQEKLVSGTNIKTLNGQSLLGNGDIVVNGGLGNSSKTLLVNILRNAVFVNDQSVNIDALATALDSEGGSSGSSSSFVVINNLSGVTTNNTATVVSAGSSYTATLTATEGSIASISVMMGGVDITETNYANGVITIASVTGNITITASNASVGGYVQDGLVHEFTALSAKKTISGGLSLVNSGADFTVFVAAKKTDTMGNYAHQWVGVEPGSIEVFIARNWNNQLRLRACEADDTSLTSDNNKTWNAPDGVDVDGMLYVWVVKNGGTVTMTVNGTAVGSISQESALVLDGDLVVNNSANPTPKLMIYNRALSEDECEQNYSCMKAEVGE